MSREFCHVNFVVFSDIGQFRATFLLKTVKELYRSRPEFECDEFTLGHLHVLLTVVFHLFGKRKIVEWNCLKT